MVAAGLPMPAIAPPLAIPPEDLRTLGHWSRSGSVRAALAERAKILLLAADGLANAEIARQVGCSRPTVILWRDRYAKAGLDGLGDKHRSGRPQTVRADRRAEILAATLTPPPEHLGVTHWSSRLLAAELGVSHNTVARVWAEHDLKPWRTETLKCSTDPELEATNRVVAALHRPRRRWCCAWTRRHRSKRFPAPPPTCRCGPAAPNDAPTTTCGTGRPRCSPPWKWPLAGSLTPARPTTATSSSWRFSSWWHGPTHGGSCTWCSTTTAPTSIPRSGHGLTATRGSTSTSPRPRRAG